MRKSDSDINIVCTRDQLKLILEKLGHQDEQDTSFITDKSVLEYHASLETGVSKANARDGRVKGLRELYPDIGNDGFLELLEGMLRFNPSFRMTAGELLQHKIFDKLRVPQHEKPAPVQV